MVDDSSPRLAQPIAALGLFDPTTISWHMHSDPAMLIAGIRTLLLQALHPRMAMIVANKSDIRTNPIGRQMVLADFITLATYHPVGEVHGYAARLRGIHRRLHAKDPHTGELFRADDPELLLWAYCAGASSNLHVLRCAGYPLTDLQADRYIDEQGRVAHLVGLQLDQIPRSSSDLDAYYKRVQSRLSCSENADVIYRSLHQPPMHQFLRPARPLYTAMVAHLAYSLLPEWAIALYGHPAYSPRTATRLVHLFRTCALRIPRSRSRVLKRYELRRLGGLTQS